MSNTVGNHLTYAERCQMSVLLKSGKSKRSIGHLLGRSHSTIVREVSRNSGGCGYRHIQAQKLAEERKSLVSRRPIKMTPELIQDITTMLWETQSSPVQISGRLKALGRVTISHESIYRMIWKDKASGGKLYLHLRHKAKKYNKRGGKTAGRGLIPNRVGIEDRPKIVEDKERFGDIELDTIVGANHQGAIVSMVDRASKLTWLSLLKRGTAEAVTDAIGCCLQYCGKQDLINTMTSDNGKEFSYHEKIVSLLGGSFYFATPYHSWERGLNEHTNGLVRQYFPKGTNFDTLSQDEVLDVQERLNNRPRKALNFKTPLEAASALCPNVPTGAFHG